MRSGILKKVGGQSIWIAGDRSTIRASGEDTGGAWALIEALVPPEGGPPPHIHRRGDEVLYVLERGRLFHTNGRCFTAGAGSLVTLARGNPHQLKNIGDLGVG